MTPETTTIARSTLRATVTAAAFAAGMAYADVRLLEAWAKRAESFSGMFQHPDGHDCPLTASGVLNHSERPANDEEWRFVGGFDAAMALLGVWKSSTVIEVID